MLRETIKKTGKCLTEVLPITGGTRESIGSHLSQKTWIGVDQVATQNIYLAKGKHRLHDPLFFYSSFTCLHLPFVYRVASLPLPFILLPFPLLFRPDDEIQQDSETVVLLFNKSSFSIFFSSFSTSVSTQQRVFRSFMRACLHVFKEYVFCMDAYKFVWMGACTYGWMYTYLYI